ncbi:Endonuclease 4 [Turnera subulata]|uniref:Aspergillus nuclease S1 n=1 Tax=Turnera subulata TaxID=218843 RepID=A0A9Q0J6F9_9ROSI|nr:Endonuclease 4 [Turnera subulata]
MGRPGLWWIVLLQLVDGILGWGKEGHYATCKIAEGYLTKDAIAAVKEFLPASAEGDLAAVCSWADQIRFHYHWSSGLHFADTPDFKCNYQYCRDCHDSHSLQNRCVTGAIFNYTMQLTSASKNSNLVSNYNLTEALMFLSHFIGDVHQPLHVGFLGDLGGNTINVHWYRRKANLHHIWDTMIIDSALKTFYGEDLAIMIEAIQSNITEDWSNQQQLWEYCENNRTVCPNMYASESISLACKFAYRNATPGSTLGDDYFLSRLPIVEKRIAQGGVRLAATLNRIFDSQTRISEA